MNTNIAIANLVADFVGFSGYTLDRAISAAARLHCVPLTTADEVAKKYRRTIIELAPFEMS